MKVVCITLTCGGFTTIGETIHSFALQDYQNKELLILDTHPHDMIFTSVLPRNVTIVKADSRRFSTLGDKTRFALNIAHDMNADYVAQFEHDDIFLSHHLSSCMRLSVPTGDPYPLRIGHRKHFACVGGVEAGTLPKFYIEENLCWCRYVFEHLKGCWEDATTDPFDVAYMSLPWTSVPLELPAIPSYIYRWDNGQDHMSGLYGQASHADLFRLFEDKFSQVDIREKPIDIAWRHDYLAYACHCFSRLMSGVMPV